MEILTDIARNKTPVRVEIEGEHTRFRSQLALKQGMVVLSKPATLVDSLSVGSHVRISVPGNEARQLRMEVTNSHFNLSNGNAVFVCDAPQPPPQPSRRAHQRYDVSRFNNLLLYLPGMDGFRLVDVSATGLKLLIPAWEALQTFPLGSTLNAAHIQVGSSARVDLEALIPRQHYVQTVGCEFQVMADGISSRYLNHLLATLDKAQAHRLQI
ncbi:MAG TPA: hypothetical protein VL359_01120 [bacterium]|nr:hypothetical protein [bacterium]